MLPQCQRSGFDGIQHLTRLKCDDRHTYQANGDTCCIPARWPNAIDCPQPPKRHRDVNTAVGGINSAGCFRMQGKQVREQGKAGCTWNQQPNRAILDEPEIGQIAADNFCQCGERE